MLPPFLWTSVQTAFDALVDERRGIILAAWLPGAQEKLTKQMVDTAKNRENSFTFNLRDLAPKGVSPHFCAEALEEAVRGKGYSITYYSDEQDVDSLDIEW